MAEQIRLLHCLTCKTLEELPDYEGDPRGDVLLEVLASRHKYDSGTPHKGHLLKVEKKHWESPSTRASIEARIRDASGHTGLDPHFYETKNTFMDDAQACFRQHSRNPGCGDYKSASKELKPDTKAERQAAGIGRYEAHGTQKRYLCEFCPVHSLVQQAARDKAIKKGLI